MNPMLPLEASLKETFPKATVTLDPPEKAGGDYFLDVKLNGQTVVIQTVRPGVKAGSKHGKHSYGGFGVSSLPSAYENAPDEFFHTPAEALARAVHLLTTGEKTKPTP
jgi:hypothetical protein